MKIKKVIPLLLACLAIVLEALPFGAVCRFARPEGEPWRKTFSYFDPVPFGYANFGPLITAGLSCILLVGLLFSVWKRKPYSGATVLLAFAAFLASLGPLLLGVEFFSVTGALISLALLIEFCLLLWCKKSEQ